MKPTDHQHDMDRRLKNIDARFKLVMCTFFASFLSLAALLAKGFGWL